MRSWRPRISIPVLLGIALSLHAQNPSPWHGRILGIEESYPPNKGRTLSLTYTDLNNLSQHGTLSSDSEMVYAFDPTSMIVYISKRNVGDSDHSLQIIPLNNMGAIKPVPYPPVCSACPGCDCTRDLPRIAVSPDGHYVFTDLAWAHPSYSQQMIVIYDTEAGRFLDSPVVFPPSQGGWIIPSSEPGSFDILTGELRLIRYRIGGREKQDGVVLSELPVRENHGQMVRDPANARTLFLCVDGKVIEITDRLTQIGQIDAQSQTRRSFPATVSGNGKLLFVPTGPLKEAANKFSPVIYIDQIDVYNAATLARLRTLRSQRGLLDVVPNQDGTMLFATIPDRPSIVLLNSETLWQEEEHLTQSPIRQITILP